MQAWILLKIFLSSWYSSHLLLLKYCLSIISLFQIWRLRRSQFAACMPCAEFPQKFCHWEICSVDTVLCEMTVCFLPIHSFIHSLKNNFRIDRMYWSEFIYLKTTCPMILCALIASSIQIFMSCKDALWNVWDFSEQQYV